MLCSTGLSQETNKWCFIVSQSWMRMTYDLHAAELPAYTPFFGYMGAACAQVLGLYGMIVALIIGAA
ncbi:hypothetical protein TELCIR_16078 [Teladorsagia circumcincta]|uniref:Uncharacterized protein n=1 Tax=Teladorsagia circumcincta TaxID=45464 RepID=A0A2G9TWT6_TELCI|nr:hypothetical protein TELCIR_16078 [Teladorsagia circumcincta]